MPSPEVPFGPIRTDAVAATATTVPPLPHFGQPGEPAPVAMETKLQVRRLILERTPLHSDVDAHSGRPVRLPKEEVTAIAAAVRELASVNAAITLSDGRAARAGLDRARDLLIPVLMRHARR